MILDKLINANNGQPSDQGRHPIGETLRIYNYYAFERPYIFAIELAQ
jgi:hypothetical protein